MGIGILSITQQISLLILLEDDNNYMFRPIPAIIKFTSERVLVFI